MRESSKQALGLLVSGMVLLVPLLAQIFGVAWWLRRNVERSHGQRLGWMDLQGLALAFNVFCSALEGLLLWLVLRLTAAMNNYLGYIGFALTGLVISYATISFLLGTIVASLIWWVERDSPPK